MVLKNVLLGWIPLILFTLFSLQLVIKIRNIIEGEKLIIIRDFFCSKIIAIEELRK